MHGPYGVAAEAYYQAGFSPLPAVGKRILVTGVTGYHRLATEQEINGWVASYAQFNIALRLPRNVIALDIDDYKGDRKKLHELEQDLVPLPKTWCADSRGGAGGKLLFRTEPSNTGWKSEARGITLVQHTHRYVLAPPSDNHESQSRVKWYDGLDGPELVDEIPEIADLAELPSVWRDFLIRSETRTMPKPFDGTVSALPDLGIFNAGPPCRRMKQLKSEAKIRLVEAYKSKTGLHDGLLLSLGKLIFAATVGHKGIDKILPELELAFVNAPRVRNLDFEWREALEYALIRNVDSESVSHVDPCTVLTDHYQKAFRKLRTKFSISQVYRMIGREYEFN